MSKPKIGCIIMASGASKRFGGNKLLAAFRGKPIFTYALDVTACDCFDKRLVLTRTREIYDFCQQMGVPVFLHEFEKRNEVVKLGIEQMEEMDACMFCLCDQPLLTQTSIMKVIDAFQQDGDGIYRLSWKGTGKSPVLFSRNFYQELKELPEKKGGGYLAERYPSQVRLVEAEKEQEVLDIDTPEDLKYMAREKKKYIILTFVSTHDAMAMEDYAHENGIPGRLIPLPSQISAGCGLAWRMLPEEYENNNLQDIKHENLHEVYLYG